MRVLYDTNVLVKILAKRGAILTFKNDVKSGLINITSQHILNEVEAVLVKKLSLTKQKAKAATRLLGRQSLIVAPKHIAQISRDPFDDYILAAAVAGKAKYLVTLDEDLLVLRNFKGIKILTPAEFLKHKPSRHP